MKLNNLAKAYVYFIFYLPIVVAFFIGIFYALIVLYNINEDTTHISNAAFGILAVFSGLCFGLARNLNEYDSARDRILYAGEKFFIAAMYMIIASIIKYATIKLLLVDVDNFLSIILDIISRITKLIYILLFYMALLDAHTALTILNKELRKRYYRYDDWDKLF